MNLANNFALSVFTGDVGFLISIILHSNRNLISLFNEYRRFKVSASGVRLNLYAPFLAPLLFCLDAERAHHIALTSLKLGLYPRYMKTHDPILANTLWDLDFPTPVGVAAGFDKNAEVFDPLLKLGFGFVETGTVTPLAQEGNDKPRMFRLPEDLGFINRLGFNNKGLRYFKRKLLSWHNQGRNGIIGANIGKNKHAKDGVSDYVKGVKTLSEFVSYIVINISSPNTPKLRDLQSRENLQILLKAVTLAREETIKHPPILLKIAPDLSDLELGDIADVAIEAKIDGIIVSNTTIGRPNSLKDKKRNQEGGLSGEPLFELSTQILREMYLLTGGQIPLIGVGGVASGIQAYEKIKAGASLVQLYSAMVYRGPKIAHIIAEELAFLLKKDGFDNITAAIGVDHA